jgi:hypothetical protein
LENEELIVEGRAAPERLAFKREFIRVEILADALPRREMKRRGHTPLDALGKNFGQIGKPIASASISRGLAKNE